jgi:hypothetical protein
VPTNATLFLRHTAPMDNASSRRFGPSNAAFSRHICPLLKSGEDARECQRRQERKDMDGNCANISPE